MKKMFVALVAAAGLMLTAGSASAQHHGGYYGHGYYGGGYYGGGFNVRPVTPYYGYGYNTFNYGYNNFVTPVAPVVPVTPYYGYGSYGYGYGSYYGGAYRASGVRWGVWLR